MNSDKAAPGLTMLGVASAPQCEDGHCIVPSAAKPEAGPLDVDAG